MQVEVRSDKPVTDATQAMVAAAVESGLKRHANRLTRAEVHLKNIGGEGPAKPFDCRIEVRPAGREPVFAHHEAVDLEQAAKGAAEKLDRLLASLFGKLDAAKGGTSASGEPT